MSIRSPTHAAFGQAVREARRRRGISQEALAAGCELDRTYIGGIEHGRRNPSLAVILKIADTLQTPAAGLLARAEATEATPPDR